jgi:hypothetical protein
MKNKITLPQTLTSNDGVFTYRLTKTHLKDIFKLYSLPLKNLKRVRGKRPMLVRVWRNHHIHKFVLSQRRASIGCRTFSRRDFNLILKVADAL